MYQKTMNCPYPHNLICAVAGKEIPSDDLPQDFEQSVEYVLENLLDQRESFMLVLRYMRGMSNREIGLYYGLATQRIRQIIDKSLRKLRHPSRYKYLVYGCAQNEPLPPRRKDRPALGDMLIEIPGPSFEQPRRKRVCQLKYFEAAGQDRYPHLMLDGADIQPGRTLKVRFPDGWHTVTLELRQETTGPACWYISTPSYTNVCPIGLFVELGAGQPN